MFFAVLDSFFRGDRMAKVAQAKEAQVCKFGATRDLISDDMSLFEEYASDFGDITLDISRNVYKIPSLSGGTLCMRVSV